MPKQKKIRAPALSSQRARQEPLGQVIDGDETRGKYATPVRARRRAKEFLNHGTKDDEFLDTKTSHKILTLSREQQLQVEVEEQQERAARQQQQQRHRQQNHAKGMIDSDDEEEEEEVEDVFLEEGEEYV
jgi:hypothetical protein